MPGLTYQKNVWSRRIVGNDEASPAIEGCGLVNMADNSELGKAQSCDKKSSSDVGSTEIVPQESGNNGGEVRSGEGGATEQRQQQAQQPSRFESFLAVTKSLIVRALLIYLITSFFRRPQDTSTSSQSGSKMGVQSVRIPASNIFEDGTFLDVYMYLSEAREFKSFNDMEALFWKKQGIMYGDWTGGPNGDGSYEHRTRFKPSHSLKNNGSIYLHVYITLHGYSPDPSTGRKYAGNLMSYNYKQLNKYKRQKFMKTHNLLTGETALTPEQLRIAENVKGETISHWHPNLTVNLVTDHTNWVQGSLPPPLEEHIVFLPGGDRYKPAIYMNDFWNLMKDYKPINNTVEYLDLSVTFHPMSLFKWQLYSSQGMRNSWTSFVFFELLAFKNDIQFWKNRKSLEGLSVRTVFFNVFQSLIVLLYVFDNDTNTIIRISCFLGLGIEIWKINKVVDIRINRESKLFGFIPKLAIKDKGSYVESSTREYDLMAFKYLSWAIYPLLVCYGIYSLIYQEHKGWYSWVLSMLYGFLLTFGFIMMTPQLFINYKLKSVAHLPWRMMTYKALNTFIDDIFAFVIKMPTMYRLGCFRDDIVFFIFLYQKFIYKTDPTRVNEFGFSAEMEEESKNKNKPAAVESKENGAVKQPPKSLEAKKDD
ncbi:UNVERIFIED_CONTAM: hypothetical protein PYX00_009669 [Menopon gallinae]|uniref:Cleft lip and palate associated transmembrane protein n=1 Tax=Menopon gallinae TaxID=328185 RepID=A0AAW2HC70_9NEOP